MLISLCKCLKLKKFNVLKLSRCLLNQNCTGFNIDEITDTVKLNIENHWKEQININSAFNIEDATNKFYILSMFPYPSGNLHMGHVRVYTISDTMARFYRMNGKNVFHPIGWDAFGLPAENAAIQRNIEPEIWTKQNISQMRQQLTNLGCSFDWAHELSTCHPNYYKWTQKIFLMLYKNGLIYQNKSLVNWDPIDETVLADEQVDDNGLSWRSGAKVEKKLLKQWFIKTTQFAKSLLNGLNDPKLQDWRDIINLQRHWIGDCTGYIFRLKINESNSHSIRIWTDQPEHLADPNSFLLLKSSHHLAKLDPQSIQIYNPFNKLYILVVINDDIDFPDQCDTYLAAPSFLEMDRTLGSYLRIPFDTKTNFDKSNNKLLQEMVIEEAQRLNLGGYKCSPKLQDWLISRQRHWGTPIPIIHCEKCGAVPVNEIDLPVKLLPKDYEEENCDLICPKCKNPNVRRETDTMDTFVDSSWYYLRYLDASNTNNLYDEKLIEKFMPVDLYIGGKEHAVLHLYYARFMNHFLHSLGLSPHSEPFKRLLVQGMVMGRSFRIRRTGKYLSEDEVEVIDRKKNRAVEKCSKEPVVMTWEKMSKSKLNGVDPSEMLSKYGTDTTRLIILADVAPTSHRNWTTSIFPGVLNWQRRIWMTLNEFYLHRSETRSENLILNQDQFVIEDEKMFDARNYYIKGVTFNYRHTHQLSVAISKMQGLTNSLRKAPKEVIKYGKQYERALASQIIMLAPMAPHFASELWSKFRIVPNRINSQSDEISWNNDVLEQKWPNVDMGYELDLTIKINGYENTIIKLPRYQLDKITCNDAMDMAFNIDTVINYVTDKKIKSTNFILYPGIEAILNIYLHKIGRNKTKLEAETFSME